MNYPDGQRALVGDLVSLDDSKGVVVTSIDDKVYSDANMNGPGAARGDNRHCSPGFALWISHASRHDRWSTGLG